MYERIFCEENTFGVFNLHFSNIQSKLLYRFLCPGQENVVTIWFLYIVSRCHMLHNARYYSLFDEFLQVFILQR